MSDRLINFGVSTTLRSGHISKHQVKSGFIHEFALNFLIYRDFLTVNLILTFETRCQVGLMDRIVRGRIVSFGIHSIFS